MAGSIRFAAGLLAVFMFSPVVATGEPVVAVVNSTLTTSAGRIRQFAFDGDTATCFVSKEKPGPGDRFTLVFDQPVSVRSVAVVTGKADGTKQDKLDSGVLEASSDGKAFAQVARFVDGEARGDLRGTRVLAVRITPTSAQDHPLAVREFAIVSDPAVAIFKFPIEIDVDCSDSPEMKDWALETARLCERWYTRINDALASHAYKPAHHITMKITTTYDGVAAASGHEITGSAKYFKAHPDDVGAMIHETVHVVQNYRSRGNPGWLVEGVADYVRFFLFEPGKIGPINARRARYDGSYRTTAAFLAYVVEKYDKSLIYRLNTAMRAGKYKEEIFKERTGKTVQELGRDWRQTLER